MVQCALVMFVGTMFFALLDSTAKFLTERYPVWEVIFIRYLSHLILFTAFLAFTKRLRTSLHSKKLRLQLLRSCLLIFTTCVFFLALRYLPLAEATAMMMLTPLFVSVLAIPLLGEVVGRHRLFCIAFGMLGALLVFRPGSALFQPAALLALTAAVLYALYQIATRMLAESDSVATTTLYTAVVGTLLAGLLAPFNWQAMEPQHFIFACLLGLHAIFSHAAIIIAFSLAPASLATAFGYVGIFWSALFGLMIFGVLPDVISWLGILLVIASGIYLLWRETHHKLPPTPLQRLPVPLTEPTDSKTDSEKDPEKDREKPSP